MRESLTVVGWFNDPAATTPAFDPGLTVACPACAAPLNTAPRVTISLMPHDAPRERSYFFRAHKACWSALSEAERVALESGVIDGHRVAH